MPYENEPLPEVDPINNNEYRFGVTCKLMWSYIITSILTLSSLTLHCHLHPLQAANCYRNSRHVVDEDDYMWVKK